MKMPKLLIDIEIERSFSLNEWEAWNEMGEKERRNVIEDMNSDDAIRDFAYDLGIEFDSIKNFEYYIKED